MPEESTRRSEESIQTLSIDEQSQDLAFTGGSFDGRKDTSGPTQLDPADLGNYRTPSSSMPLRKR